MKKLIYAVLFSISLLTYSQAQDSGFNYQAVARTSIGDPMVNEIISIRISLIRGGALVDYCEMHQGIVTNDLGLFNLVIGKGELCDFGAFEKLDELDWANEKYEIKIDMDPDGGNTYSTMGVSKLQAVPYALFAATAGNSSDGDTDDENEIQTLVYDEATNTLSISGGNSITLPNGTADDDDNPLNEIQTITKSGYTIELSNGGGSVTDEVNDADANPLNEIQTITKNGNAIELSNGGGSVTDEVNDADADPSNEIQTISFDPVTNMLTISDGNDVDLSQLDNDSGLGGTDNQQITISGTVISLEDGGSIDLAGLIPPGGSDDQTLSFSGTTLTLEDGGSVDLAPLQDGVNDADADPSNELQSIFLSGTVISLSDGGTVDLAGLIPPGGTDDQTLSLSGTVLSLEDGGSVDLSPIIPPGGSDDQNISLSGTILTLEDGGSVDLSSLPDNVNDADSNPVNELQSLTLSGTTISLSDGGSVDLSPILPAGGTDDQNLSLSGNQLTLEDGGSVDLTPLLSAAGTDNQTLSLSGNTLSITNGNTVDLTALLSSPVWDSNASGINYNSGQVGINTASPEAELHVNGNLFVNSSLGGLNIGFQGDNNKWRLGTFSGGADLLFLSKSAGNPFAERIRFMQDGKVGIGTTPSSPLHVESDESGLSSIVRGIYSNFSVTEDVVGVHGFSRPVDNYGIGGFFEGGYIGLDAIVEGTGGNYETYYGIYSFSSIGGVGQAYGLTSHADGTSNQGSIYGVYGRATGGDAASGVYGVGESETAFWNTGVSSVAVNGPFSNVGNYAYAEGGTNAYGVLADVESPAGSVGVFAQAYNSTSGGFTPSYGVYGTSSGGGLNHGIYGEVDGNGAQFGVSGVAINNGTGSGNTGVYGTASGENSFNVAVQGFADNSFTGSSFNYGGFFSASGGQEAYGVQSSGSTAGVIGSNLGGLAGIEYPGDPYGFEPTTAGVVGVADIASLSVKKAGIFSRSEADPGEIYNYGMYTYSSGSTNANWGLFAHATSEVGTSAIGIEAEAEGTGNNIAGRFIGDVEITGNLSKAGGTFKIDHPQDPENKFLIHSFVESPDMINIYNGNIHTDASGMATVELPSYFEAENIEFKYQLTVIGTFAQAIIKEEVSNNQFVIQTNEPNVKVSWQVTGVRNDAWAQANRVIPELEKNADEKGGYLHPELYGKDKSYRIDKRIRAKQNPTSGDVKKYDFETQYAKAKEIATKGKIRREMKLDIPKPPRPELRKDKN